MSDKKLFLQCDDSTVHMNASHVFQSDYLGNKGADRCLEMFGEQSDECIAYNLTLEYDDKDFIPGA